ncbi:hypothetical protein TrVE_jg11672 [Triparma verrucosa]|uniref:START domain-containing protein n=1 Tax=Triparma verrucosa TaxID=1606542 RepID=A0A9W6Z9P7_9STRA|nr:hypothetical protein TrVE_jg11672 [Triparma verrucosa]
MQWEWDTSVDKSTVVRLCLNCNPACVNFNSSVNPHRHATGGMCGACNQKWNRLPPRERWKVRHCTSRCRCIKCFPVALPESVDVEQLFTKVRRKTAVGCVNCESMCPNKGLPAIAKKHATSGMCGSCTQRWNRHANSRWPVLICTSKCRCDRCRSTPMLEEEKVATLHTSLFDPRMLSAAASRVGGIGVVNLASPPSLKPEEQHAVPWHQQHMQALQAQYAKMLSDQAKAAAIPGLGYPLYPNPYTTAATLATQQAQQAQQQAQQAQQQLQQQQQQQQLQQLQQQQHHHHHANLALIPIPEPLPTIFPSSPTPPALMPGAPPATSTATATTTTTTTTTSSSTTSGPEDKKEATLSLSIRATLYANQIMEQLVAHQNSQREQLVASQEQEKATILAHLASNQSYPSAKYLNLENDALPYIVVGADAPVAALVAVTAPSSITAPSSTTATGTPIPQPQVKCEEPKPLSNVDWPLINELTEGSKAGVLFGATEATLIFAAVNAATNSVAPLLGTAWLFGVSIERTGAKTRPSNKKAKLSADVPSVPSSGTISIPRCFTGNVYSQSEVQTSAVQLFKTLFDICSNEAYHFDYARQCSKFSQYGFKTCSSSDSSVKVSIWTPNLEGFDPDNMRTPELLARYIVSKDFLGPEFEEVKVDVFEKQQNSRVVRQTVRPHFPYLVSDREFMRFQAWTKVGKSSYFIVAQSVDFEARSSENSEGTVRAEADLEGYFIRPGTDGTGVLCDLVRRCDLKGRAPTGLVQTMFGSSGKAETIGR